MSKYWREASSVIIAARTSFPKTGTKQAFAACKVDSQSKKIVENETSTDNQRSSTVNFKVLSLKRGSKDTFMPDSYVFPGGNVDVSDSSKKWLELFDECGPGRNSFETIDIVKRNQKINIFENHDKNELQKFISLRITGIRETFEECGILLCKSKRVHSDAESSKWASYLTGHDIREWQERVRKDASEFIKLFKHFDCYPDIWSLKEWSNWLTPISHPKRFNTVFFIATLDQIPPAFIDDVEMSELKWSTPEEVLNLCVGNKVILQPPQFYELARLGTFHDIDDLADFADQKNKEGSELWMALRIKTSDGLLTIFPGDDMYPEDPAYESSSPMQKTEKTALELRGESKCLHRTEHTKQCNTRLLLKNVASVQNHIVPPSVPA